MRRKTIDSKEVAYNYAKGVFRGLDHEELWVLYLDLRHEPISFEKMTSGGWDSTVLDIRQIFATALNLHSSRLIIFHNHLSGSSSPSINDVRNTDKIFKSGEFMDIKILDHIIIAETNYYSFTDETITEVPKPRKRR